MDIEKINHVLTGRKRVKPLLQTETSECGLCCIVMICNFYGNDISIQKLRSQYLLSQRGIRLNDIVEICSTLGFNSRPLRLELEEIQKLEVPCILHWSFNHFVVLTKFTRKGIEVCDPISGRTFFPMSEVSKCFTGVALELRPGSEFKVKSDSKVTTWKSLTGPISGLKRSFTAALCFAFVLEVLGLLSPLFLQTAIDHVVVNNDSDLLTLLGIGFTIMMLASVAIDAFRNWYVTNLSAQFGLSWTERVFAHMIRLPLEFFHKRHLGDIVSRFGSISTIQQSLTTNFITSIMDGLMAAVTLGLLFVYNVPLGILSVLSFCIYVALRVMGLSAYREANSNQLVTSARLQSRLFETLRGIQTVRLFNGSSSHTTRFTHLAAEVANRNLTIQRMSLIYGTLNKLVAGLHKIAIIWIGTVFTLDGTFTAGMLISFVTYSGQFSDRSAKLIDYVVQLRILKLQGERLAEIVHTEQEQALYSDYLGEEPKASISVNNLGFRYSTNEPLLLNGCSFTVKEGEFVAIVGKSGSGKSTICRILLGLLEPQQGSIRLGDIDIKRIGKTKLRSVISSVMQDDCLFGGTIADNISFFDPAASQLDIEAAAKMSAIHLDIVQMPMGYHTSVGDMGSSLSGGQRQRIILARALYRKPKILLLDEATSHLDVHTEHLVSSAIGKLDITRIVVAHRPETVSMADRVIVIDQGKAINSDMQAFGHSHTNVMGSACL